MRLSVCMIVRNESSMLAGALESIRELADEIVVVDTGSTDDTVRIAQSFGAIVLHEQWRNDFSYARNISLEAAGGDWILILDADERIAKRDHPRIREILSMEKAAYRFTQRHYGAGEGGVSYRSCAGQYPEYERGFSGFSMTELTRLFPNDRRIRFSGIVYEFVEPSIRERTSYRLLRSAVPIHHYGNTNERRSERDKDRLYLELFREKLKSDPSPETLRILGIMAEKSGELTEAEQAFRRYLEMVPSENGVLIRLAEVLSKQKLAAEAIDAFLQALANDHLDPLVHAHLGALYLRERRLIFAEAHIKRSLELAPGLVASHNALLALEAAKRRFLVSAIPLES